jgi:hypothetical protein
MAGSCECKGFELNNNPFFVHDIVTAGLIGNPKVCFATPSRYLENQRINFPYFFDPEKSCCRTTDELRLIANSFIARITDLAKNAPICVKLNAIEVTMGSTLPYFPVGAYDIFFYYSIE